MILRTSVLTVLSIAALARAQPQDALIAELEASQRRAADKAVTIREREQAADKAMELRARAIESAKPDDPRLPNWLMDNAAGELGRLARDGSDTAVLFAIPLPAQVEAVRQGATRAADLLDKAAAMLAERRKAAEGSPVNDPVKLQLEQDGTVRIPFFASRAAILLAAGESGEARTRHARAAHDAVGKLALSAPGPESIRRVTIGAALLMRSQPPDAADLQTAIDEFGWVLTGGAGGKAQAGSSPTTRAEAWYGLIAAAGGLGRLDTVLEQFREAQKAEPFMGPDGRADSLLAVLATDAVSRAWVERAAATHDRAPLDKAVNEQQLLLRRSDLSLRPDSLRPLVYQKLHLVGARAPDLDLPPAMDLAGAIDAARDPARRDDAVKRLRAVAAAADAGDFAVDALWELAVLLTPGSTADRLSAVEALVRIARDFPDSPRATAAISAALPHAQALAHDAAAGADLAYRGALTLATSRFQDLPSIDIWRYEFARVLMDRASPPLEDQRAALEALRLIKPGAPSTADATRLLERVQAQVLDEGWKRITAARRVSRAESVQRLCREEVLPEARRAVQWATTAKSASLDRFRADLADALMESGDAGGQKIFEDLISRSVEVPGSWPRLKLGLARSLLIAGQSAAAFGMLRDLATALDAPPAASSSEPARPRPETFWHAWTLMLEELAIRNDDGARSGTIRAHVKRLETIDKDLGGEPWRSRITAVRDKVKG